MPTPEPSSLTGGRSFSASLFSGPSSTLSPGTIHYLPELSNVGGGRPAPAADDRDVSFGECFEALGHLLGRFLVKDLHVLEDRKPGVRLRHDGEARDRSIALRGIDGVPHVDARPAVESPDGAAGPPHELRRLLGARPHHRAD